MKFHLILIGFAISAFCNLCTAQSSVTNSEDSLAFFQTKELYMAFAFCNFIENNPRSKFLSEARSYLGVFDTSIAKYNTRISTKTLTEHFGWNGVKKFWSWGLANYTDSNDNRVLEKSIDNTTRGIEFDFNNKIKLSGKFCIGNLQFDGEVTLSKNGLLLYKGTSIIYTKLPQF